MGRAALKCFGAEQCTEVGQRTYIVQQASSAIATAIIQGYLSPMTNCECTFIESFLPPWCEPGTKPEWLTNPDGGGICVWTRDVGTARFGLPAKTPSTPAAAQGWAAELVAAAGLAQGLPMQSL
jgi:hypothetical protein